MNGDDGADYDEESDEDSEEGLEGGWQTGLRLYHWIIILFKSELINMQRRLQIHFVKLGFLFTLSARKRLI